MKALVIRDEIHGDLQFDGILREVIDHESFQRLRYIKQLGLAEYVFPCATHTRFQHSLGASYLAGNYFDSFTRAWLSSPLGAETTTGNLHADATRRAVEAAASEPASFSFWKRVVSLSGLLHDVGHGPWSHTFEFLEIPQDFSEVVKGLTGTVGTYFANRAAEGTAVKHEDVSLLYIYTILRDIEKSGRSGKATQFFLPVAALVHKGLMEGALGGQVEKELAAQLQQLGVRGGVEMHRLLRPIVSGPFDVDRIDYIQRDGRNCGVSIGGIEWRRIVTKLIPCLANHQNERGEPSDVVLISNMKNQHVLDDFIFSLFQMYAQVYLHPKIVGLEETVKRLLVERKGKRKAAKITFDSHRSLTDEKFRAMLKSEFGLPELDAILQRDAKFKFQVASSWGDAEIEKALGANGYSEIELADRPMMKDSMGVFLYSSIRGSAEFFVRPWSQISPIAKQFYQIHYSPRTWVKWDTWR